MLEITSYFYYFISSGCLFLCYYYLRHPKNRFGQNFIILFGILGLYVSFYNCWGHTLWVIYTITSIILYIILNIEAEQKYKEAEQKQKEQNISFCLQLVALALELLFYLEAKYQYGSSFNIPKLIISALVTYTITITIQVIVPCEHNDHNRIHYLCMKMIIILIVSYFNALTTDLWNIWSFIPAVIWAHCPYQSKTHIYLQQQKQKKMFDQFQKQKQKFKDKIKQKDCKIQEQGNKLKQMLKKQKMLLQKQQMFQKRICWLKNQTNYQRQSIKNYKNKYWQNRDAVKIKEIQLKVKEDKISQLLKINQQMQEQIILLKNSLKGSQEKQKYNNQQENEEERHQNFEVDVEDSKEKAKESSQNIQEIIEVLQE